MNPKTPKTPENTTDKEQYTSIFDAPTAVSEKPVKKRRISKRALNTIVALVVCAALGAGAFAAVHFWGKDDTDDDSSSGAESEAELSYVFDLGDYSSSATDGDNLKMGPVTNVVIKNEHDTFAIVPTLGKTTQIDSNTGDEVEKDTTLWEINAAEKTNIYGITFNSTRVSFILGEILAPEYISVYAEDKNASIPQGDKTYLEECGLDSPVSSAKVSFKDGSEYTIYCGDKTPTGTDRFITIECKSAGNSDELSEDSRIYRVEQGMCNFLEKDLTYFVQTDIIKAIEDETTYTETGDEIADKYFISGELSYFDNLELSGTNFEKPVKFTNVDADTPPHNSIYMMTSPVSQNVDVDKMTALLKPLNDGLSANSCAVISPSTAQLEQYGLAKPAVTASYTVKNVNYTINIGNTISDESGENTYYAVMIKGNPAVFLVEQSYLSALFTKASDYVSKNIYSCDITKLKTVTFTKDGVSTVFDLSFDEKDSSNLTVYANGKTVDTQSFREAYVNFLSVTAFESVENGADSANPYVTVAFTYRDYPGTDTVRFSPLSDRRYFASLNGQGSFAVLSTGLDKFVDSITALIG